MVNVQKIKNRQYSRNNRKGELKFLMQVLFSVRKLADELKIDSYMLLVIF